jgi:hypothetical protein
LGLKESPKSFCVSMQRQKKQKQKEKHLITYMLVNIFKTTNCIYANYLKLLLQLKTHKKSQTYLRGEKLAASPQFTPFVC